MTVFVFYKDSTWKYIRNVCSVSVIGNNLGLVTFIDDEFTTIILSLQDILRYNVIMEGFNES